jgi:hypothetical protein
MNSDQFNTRKPALRELENIGDIAAPALQNAMANNVTLKLRQRVERLLNKFSSSQPLRTLRAVQILGHSGTLEANAFVRRLAQG